MSAKLSLFLLYFEVGRPVPPTAFPSTLVATPISLRFQGRVGPARSAVTLTDGLASDHFQQSGSTVAARRGEALRGALDSYLRERLAHGARPHVVFTIFHGSVEAAEVDFDHRREVPIAEVAETLVTLARDQVVEVTGG